MRFGPGIRPSRTSSSNLLADMPRYIAASSRDNPRRGIGRTAERPVDRFVPCGAADVGVGRFKSFGLSSARSDLVFALGDELLSFIAGSPICPQGIYKYPIWRGSTLQRPLALQKVSIH